MNDCLDTLNMHNIILSISDSGRSQSSFTRSKVIEADLLA